MSRAQSRWAELVDALDLPEDGCSISTLVDKVADHCDQPITLVPITEPGPYSGLVLRTQTGCLIMYRLGGGGLHQAHIVAHELSHLLLGHEPDSTVGLDACGDPTAGALQMLDGGTAELMATRQVLCRTSFEREREADAETLAWLLLQRAGRRRAAAGGPLARVLAPRPAPRRR